jgi:hypothetical protein
MKPAVSIALALAALFMHTKCATAANVTVIHGIDGRDLGLTRALPVDISVNDTCALKGVTFKQSAQVKLGAGDYNVKVFVATGSCAGTAVIDKTVTIPESAENEAFSLVASLTGRGNPQLAVFQNTGIVWPLPGLSVRHLAKAGSVKVGFEYVEFGRRTPTEFSTIRNGKEVTRYVLGTKFQYRTSIDPSPAASVVTLKGDVRRTLRVLYVVGSAANGFSVITENVKLRRN